jgi:ABC-type transporter MlaC component
MMKIGKCAAFIGVGGFVLGFALQCEASGSTPTFESSTGAAEPGAPSTGCPNAVPVPAATPTAGDSSTKAAGNATDAKNKGPAAPSPSENPAIPALKSKSDAPSAPQSAATATAQKTLALLTTANPSMKDVVTQAADAINDLLLSNRADQTSIYLFVRAVNRNLRCIKNNDSDVNRIHELTSELLKQSYTDQLFQNKNLSNQIQTRLPLLIADSVELTNPSLTDPQRRQAFADFKEDLELLAGRIDNAKRFRIGLGIQYSYLPDLQYRAATQVDFSPYQLPGTGGIEPVSFNTDFTNRSMFEAVLSARVPYTLIEIGIPDRTQTETSTTTVQESPATATTDILSRTTINSKLAIVYDVTASLLVSEIATRYLDLNAQGYQLVSRLTAGVGAGLTGFQIADSSSTDVRLRTDPTKTFNSLPTTGTITSSQKTAFNSAYGYAHVRYYVSDEVEVGVSIRRYLQSHSGSAVADISGVSAALTIVWYPTFGWQK